MGDDKIQELLLQLVQDMSFVKYKRGFAMNPPIIN